MRAHITLVETYLLENAESSYYQEGAEWLHGGPLALRGGRFERGGRRGKDMGGLFFVRADMPEAWSVALAYTFRYAEGAVWRCRINLGVDEVFSLMNAAHRDKLSEVLPGEDVAALVDYAKGGYLPWGRSPDWQANIERLLTSVGFRAYVVQERGHGALGTGRNAVSLCVFDPNTIQIIDHTHRADGLAAHHGRAAL